MKCETKNNIIRIIPESKTDTVLLNNLHFKGCLLLPELGASTKIVKAFRIEKEPSMAKEESGKTRIDSKSAF